MLCNCGENASIVCVDKNSRVCCYVWKDYVQYAFICVSEHFAGVGRIRIYICLCIEDISERIPRNEQWFHVAGVETGQMGDEDVKQTFLCMPFKFSRHILSFQKSIKHLKTKFTLSPTKITMTATKLFAQEYFERKYLVGDRRVESPLP